MFKYQRQKIIPLFTGSFPLQLVLGTLATLAVSLMITR